MFYLSSGLSVVCVLTALSVGLAQEKATDPENIGELLVERRDRLRQLSADMRKRLHEGNISVKTYLLIRRWKLQADLDLCESVRARAVRLKQWVIELRELESDLGKMLTRASCPPNLNRLDVDEVGVLRLEAQIDWERAKLSMAPKDSSGIPLWFFLFGGHMLR